MRAGTTTGGLVIIAGLLTIFDAAATWAWLQLGVTEGNPIVRMTVHHLGVTAGMAVRAAWGLVLLIGLARLADRHWFANAALIGVTIAMAIVGLVHVAGGTSTVLTLM